MRPLIQLVVPLGLAIALAPVARAYDAAALREAKQALQRGVNRADVAELREARARFQALAALEPQSPELQYWMAVADWRLVPLLANRKDAKSHKDQARRHCEAWIAAAERALELDPKSAEALALKVGLQGLSLTLVSPAAMMTLGPRMESDIGRALGMAPENPRVHLLDGINTLHKPGFVGGGARNALPKLEKAIQCFARQGPVEDAAPDWGRDDACLWAGRAAMRLQQYQAARAFYLQALELNPDNGWVRAVLLPAAEKALSAQSERKEKS